MIGFVDVVFQ